MRSPYYIDYRRTAGFCRYCGQLQRACIAMALLMVLHDVNQAVRYSDTIMVMKNGEMLMAGVPEEVITEQAMKDIYGVNVAIRREEETGLIVVPLSIV